MTMCFGYGLRILSIGRIDEHGHTSCRGHQFTQEPQSLCRQLRLKKLIPVALPPGRAAARPGEAGDKTKPDRGSSLTMKTTGIVVVAAFAANAGLIPRVRGIARLYSNSVKL
jgi:hypothetical protein